jgi:hypothetical protein
MRRPLLRLAPKARYPVLALITVISLLLPLMWPSQHRSDVEAKTMNRILPAAPAQISVREVIMPAGDNPSGATSGLHLTLSEGAEPITATTPLTPAPATPLAVDATQQLLARLPDLVTETADVQAFNLPPQTLPPPRPGVTISETFPLTDTLPAPADVISGALAVVRYAPEGEIALAPFLNVTFNQPMVPLATLEQLSVADVPVQITPELPGVWKWIGTKTLTFEYGGDDLNIDRFPKATVYTVTIPAGTQSALGGELAETVTFSFHTPPPKLDYTYPTGGPYPTQPVLFIRFDQAIQPDAVLETISVTAGGKEYPVRLATQEEIAANRQVQQLITNSREERWLAFRAEEAFPTDTTVVVNVGPGTPSAEGPLTTEEIQSYSFTTYAPLRITEANCGWAGAECPPFSSFYIQFNNPLDQTSFDPALVQVEPAIPGLIVNAYGATLEIRGGTQGRTTYNVTVSGDIQDIFGQTLGQDETRTFKTGPAPSYLSGAGGNFITLDPSADKATYTLYTINYERVRVRIYQVTPADWPAYLRWVNEYGYQDNPPALPGELLVEETLTIEAATDAMVETSIDLSAALPNGLGHAIVLVDVPQGLLSSLFGGPDRSRALAWVQVTQIGLDAFVDRGQLFAWATALSDGTPLPGVNLTLVGPELTTVTSEDGTARFDLTERGAGLLIGQLENDSALLPQNTYYWDTSSYGGWLRQTVQDELRWYLWDDRQMYRPGETVYIKGWLRQIGGGATGDVGLVGSSVTAIQYTVSDPQGNQLAQAAADVNDLGGFDFRFTLPENTNLGSANIYLSARSAGNLIGTDTYHSFQIQEFRRPEFSVSARNETTGPFLVGDAAVVAVSAQYFAGGPLPNAETTWNLSVSPSTYNPPNWPDFTFGRWIPWWFGDFAAESARYEARPGSGAAYTFQGKTDATGTHYLRLNFDRVDEPQPYSVLADATVMDVNRQAWAAATGLLVHPAARYVGIRSERYFVQQGEPLSVDAIVTDIEGNAVAEVPVTVQAARLEWKFTSGRWQEVEADLQECTVDSTNEPVTCTFATPLGGSYRISATVQDAQERTNFSEFTRWVGGGQRPTARTVEQEEVTLIPSQESYQPGEVAEILVQAPFSPAEGLATISRGDIVRTERFTVEDGTYTLVLPITEAHIPNLTVQVDLNGSAPRTDDNGEPLAAIPPRPAFATGRIELAIPPVSRTLQVQAEPAAKALAPGAETSLAITVTDAAGQPVENAELAVVVVDEAILALSNYQLRNPLDIFYTGRYANVSSTYGRSSILLADPQALAENVANQAAMGGARGEWSLEMAAPAAAAPMAAESAESMTFADEAVTATNEAAPAITMRSDFNPLALFAPAIRTDAAGSGRIDYKLPDNLTRYRIMVVAVAEGKFFGSSAVNLTARLPLMVRPSAPRFLNFGDRFALPVVIQNQTDTALEVSVALRSSNLQLISGTVISGTVGTDSLITDSLITGQLVTVPPNDRVEVRFPATTLNAGTARVQIAAAAGDYADAATIELPVYTPATTEAFAVYGVVDEGAVAQPVATPQEVFPQFGGLEINTSSTALQALTDAVIYLVNYPYGCSEQLASRILGVAALRDVLSAFNAEGLPPAEELEKALQADIERLQALQNDNGGWPIWERGDESVPYYSIHVAHALQRAKLKGFTVPEAMQQRALDHLRNIEAYYPAWYGATTRHALSAYALYVRQLMGDVDTAKARSLLGQYPLEEQSLEAIGWLWQVLSDDAASQSEVEAIRRHVNNRAVETAGAANFTTSYGEEAYVLLHSNRRTDGILLDALINDQPESDLIPKVVNGLLADKTAGRWSNTQENAFILLALDRYFNTFEAQTPDFVARVWLGADYVAEHTYEGRTIERHETVIPMGYLVEESGEREAGSVDSPLAPRPSPLIISKEGEGRLYYRLGLRYAPTDLDLDPLEMGFVVQRRYEAVDNPADVQMDAEGVWRIKAGARVRVRVTMVADNRRYHVALVDPLPAGLEIINPALATAEAIPQDPNQPYTGWWWWGSWFQHQNLRDQRAEAFTTLLWDGVYDYTYVARATTPGEFIVPPAKAEEMYSPEVFGRSASDRVVVE